MPKVKVDWIKYNGCGTCIDTYPALAFELQNLLGYSESKKSRPARVDDCVLCMICETSCHDGAIRVEK